MRVIVESIMYELPTKRKSQKLCRSDEEERELNKLGAVCLRVIAYDVGGD
jgi:hypothetical protein